MTTSASTPLVGERAPPASLVRWRLLGRIAIVTFACVIASGPLSAFPTLQPLLEAQGVFYRGNTTEDRMDQLHRLSEVYTISSGLNSCSFIVTGYLYDRFGARFAGSGGAIGVSLGLVLMFLCTRFQSANALIYFALPFSDVMGLLNSMTLFGFLWHTPNHQALLMGIGNASYQVSAVMGFALVAVTGMGLALPYGFLAFAALAFISALVSYPFAVSPKEFFDEADRVMGIRQKPVDTAFYVIASVSCYVELIYYITYLYPFLLTEFDDATATRLSNAFSLAYTVAGAVLTPMLGLGLDRLGLQNFIAIMTLVLAGFNVAVHFPSYPLQFLAMILGCIYICAWMTLSTKWAVYYAPPDLFGTYFGLVFCFTGAVQVACNLLLPRIMADHFGKTSRMQYEFVFYVFGGISVAASIFLVIVLMMKGLPKTPPMPRNDPKRLSVSSVNAPDVSDASF